MGEPARKLDESRVRRALARLLVPDVIARVIEEARDPAEAPATRPEKAKPSPEAIERARAWARKEASRR